MGNSAFNLGAVELGGVTTASRDISQSFYTTFEEAVREVVLERELAQRESFRGMNSLAPQVFYVVVRQR